MYTNTSSKSYIYCILNFILILSSRVYFASDIGIFKMILKVFLATMHIIGGWATAACKHSQLFRFLYYIIQKSI